MSTVAPRPIHPFPARMAPEIALGACDGLKRGKVVLDPMCGSGTVLRVAADKSHHALGFDMDPLAVLISSVFANRCSSDCIRTAAKNVRAKAQTLDGNSFCLPFVDCDEETRAFAEYWFAPTQLEDLRKLAWVLRSKKGQTANALRVALSRMVITKDGGASLASDTSHSRPHKTKTENDFDVFGQFQLAAEKVATLLECDSPRGSASVRRGDARRLTGIEDKSVDLIITSPPYLNAIDYMRGHKLSLIWLGFSAEEMRRIRSTSIGSERSLDVDVRKDSSEIAKAGVDLNLLGARERAIVVRYADDVRRFCGQVGRVLKKNARAVCVVGNSCLREVYINNAEMISHAASQSGMMLESELVRDLPQNKRYLPPPNISAAGLAKRMRTEAVLTFRRVA